MVLNILFLPNPLPSIPESHLLLSYDTCMYQPPLRDVWPFLDQKRKMIHNSDVTYFSMNS